MSTEINQVVTAPFQDAAGSTWFVEVVGRAPPLRALRCR